MFIIWQALVLYAGENTGAVCIPNINRREQRRRLLFGVVQSVISLGVVATLLARGTNRWWRLPLMLLFWSAAVGIFQWRDKT